MTVKIDGTNGLIQQYDYQTPTTGFSYTFLAGSQVLVMNPAGTLATGTITMPANPSDGMTIKFSSSQQITALTVAANTGQTINNAILSLPSGQAMSYVYRAASNAWFAFSTGSITSVGVGQTWTDMTVSRAYGTTYTNSTGRAIFVSAYISLNTGTPQGDFYIDGNLIASDLRYAPTTRQWISTMGGIVLNGSTYLINGGGTLNKWWELR